MTGAKFRLDDRVRVTAVTLGTFDKAGVVVEIKPDAEYPIRVAIEGQTTFGFAEHELVLAESAAEVIDAMLAESGAPDDAVSHPSHYTSHPSGVECLTITRHMSFTLGSAMKYIWRADLKGNAIQDLEKAVFYIQDEIARRKAAL